MLLRGSLLASHLHRTAAVPRLWEALLELMVAGEVSSASMPVQQQEASVAGAPAAPGRLDPAVDALQDTTHHLVLSLLHVRAGNCWLRGACVWVC